MSLKPIAIWRNAPVKPTKPVTHLLKKQYGLILLMLLLMLLLSGCSYNDYSNCTGQTPPPTTTPPTVDTTPTPAPGGDIGQTILTIIINLFTAPASFLGNLSLTTMQWLLDFAEGIKFDYPTALRTCSDTGPGATTAAISLEPLTRCATQVYDTLKWMPVTLMSIALFVVLANMLVSIGLPGVSASFSEFLTNGIAATIFSINMDVLMSIIVDVPMKIFFFILTATPSNVQTAGSSSQDSVIQQLTDGFKPLFVLDASVHHNNFPLAVLLSFLAIVTGIALLAISLTILVRNFLLIFWFILSPLALSSLLLPETTAFFRSWKDRLLLQAFSVLPLAAVLRVAVVLEGAIPDFKTNIFNMLVMFVSVILLLGISLAMAWRFILVGELRQSLQLTKQVVSTGKRLAGGAVDVTGRTFSVAGRIPVMAASGFDAVGAALLGTASYMPGSFSTSTGLLGSTFPGLGRWRTTTRESATLPQSDAARAESAGGSEVYADNTPKYMWPQTPNSNPLGNKDHELQQTMQGIYGTMQMATYSSGGVSAPPLRNLGASSGGSGTRAGRRDGGSNTATGSNSGNNSYAGTGQPEGRAVHQFGTVQLYSQGGSSEAIDTSGYDPSQVIGNNTNAAISYGNAYSGNGQQFYNAGAATNTHQTSTSGGFYGNATGGGTPAPVASNLNYGQNSEDIYEDTFRDDDSFYSVLANNQHIINASTGSPYEFSRMGVNTNSAAPTVSSMGNAPVRQPINRRSAERLNASPANTIAATTPLTPGATGGYNTPLESGNTPAGTSFNPPATTTPATFTNATAAVSSYAPAVPLLTNNSAATTIAPVPSVMAPFVVPAPALASPAPVNLTNTNNNSMDSSSSTPPTTIVTTAAPSFHPQPQPGGSPVAAPIPVAAPEALPPVQVVATVTTYPVTPAPVQMPPPLASNGFTLPVQIAPVIVPQAIVPAPMLPVAPLPVAVKPAPIAPLPQPPAVAPIQLPVVGVQPVKQAQIQTDRRFEVDASSNTSSFMGGSIYGSQTPISSSSTTTSGFIPAGFVAPITPLPTFPFTTLPPGQTGGGSDQAPDTNKNSGS